MLSTIQLCSILNVSALKPVLLRILILLILVLEPLRACAPGKNARFKKQFSHQPFDYEERQPDCVEDDIKCSGPLNRVLDRDSTDFKKYLVQSKSDDMIAYDDSESDMKADTRLMHRITQEKLELLSMLVMNQNSWPSGYSYYDTAKARRVMVVRAYDPRDQYSLHAEGRALDLVFEDSNGAETDLTLLARLARNAGFDFVWLRQNHEGYPSPITRRYGTAYRVHVSVSTNKRNVDYSQMEMIGCFAGSNEIRLESGIRKLVSDLRVGDRVPVLSSSGYRVYSSILFFLDHKLNETAAHVKITFSNDPNNATDSHLILTPRHLIFRRRTGTLNRSETVFAADIVPGDFLSVVPDGETMPRWTLVTRVSWVEDRTGYFAPVTSEGNIIVGRVVTSCYAEWNHEYVISWLFAPLVWFSQLSLYLSDVAPRMPIWCSPLATLLFDVSGGFMTANENSGIHWYAHSLKWIAQNVSFLHCSIFDCRK